MNNFWITLLSSAGVSGALSIVLVWLCREWISARLKKSIQHEYDVKLEAFKALQQKELEGYKVGYQKFLAENEIRFSNWHQEKANAIKIIFNGIVDDLFAIIYLYGIECDEHWKKCPEDLRKQFRLNIMNRIWLSAQMRNENWLKPRMYLTPEDERKGTDAYNKIDNFFSWYFSYFDTVTQENGEKEMIFSPNRSIDDFKNEGKKKMDELDQLMESVRCEFQKALCGSIDKGIKMWEEHI